MSLPASPGYRVEAALWARDAPAIAQVRRQVFIAEQGVPEDLEWEARDPDCEWFVARDPAGQVMGIVRLVPEQGLGRMAVVPAWRRRGVASALLRVALDRARALGWRQVRLHAQTHAADFYLRFGFTPVGQVFEEAGIPHLEMVLSLEK